ncbi:MAG: hypothetical protein JXQ87_17890 [Bacteroidia bacterium]
MNSCSDDKGFEVINTRVHAYYRDGSIQNDYDSFRYFIRKLDDDSGYCINRIIGSIYNKATINSLKCIDRNNDSIAIGTYSYLPTFLYHKEYCRPRYQSIKEIEDKARYYKFESRRTYTLNNNNYDINSYYIDAYGSDLGHRLYFSPKLGLIAAIATSWGNMAFYENERDSTQEELKAKLKSDSLFFPKPIETTVQPPEPK